MGVQRRPSRLFKSPALRHLDWSRGAVWACDVTWLLCSVAFECNVQAKEKQKDPKIRFHTFPKDKELRQAWIHAIGRTSLPKNPRLCSKHFEEHCFKQSYLMEVRLLGSSRMLNPLKTDALPTIFSHRKSAPIRLSSVKRAEKRKHMEVCVCLFICIIHMNGCELASSRFFYYF